MNLEEKLVQELKDNEHVIQIVPVQELFNEWEAMKGLAEVGAATIAPLIDSTKAFKIIKELGISANKVIVKNYLGKQYLILKGYSGKREILTGTRYLTANPKVVRMAIGPKESKNQSKLALLSPSYFQHRSKFWITF